MQQFILVREQSILNFFTGLCHQNVGVAFLFFLFLFVFSAQIVQSYLLYSLYGRLKQKIAHLSRTVERQAIEIARNRFELASRSAPASDSQHDDGEAEPEDEKTLMERVAKSLPHELHHEDAEAAQRLPRENGETSRTEHNRTVQAVNLSPQKTLALLKSAIQDNTIEITSQPIVSLPQRQVRMFELFSRIPVDSQRYINAAQFVDLAREEKLLPAVDTILLLKALQTIRTRQKGDVGISYVLNVAARTLNDVTFMTGLTEFLGSQPHLAPRLVFEFTQSDMRGLNKSGLAVIEQLSRLGCRFSIDQVQQLGLDVSALEAKHVRFVKISADRILTVLKSKEKIRVKALINNLTQSGIDLIIERIETEKQLLTLLDLYIDYGQGYLFGKPTLLGDLADAQVK